ncbi:hypothetical protein FQA47_023065 [Oryzias melastigma]|uniref:Uncharacterized protein n=1 Tax=Oryzias melastigma TaxID=30732 RepID=A0A834FCQ2_ORYME|nr:hypothetical protein FQA47_023065 [Oryzias melastigma]
MRRWSGESGDEEEAKLPTDRIWSATPHASHTYTPVSLSVDPHRRSQDLHQESEAFTDDLTELLHTCMHTCTAKQRHKRQDRHKNDLITEYMFYEVVLVSCRTY